MTMGVTEAPQWLVPAFVRSAKAIGANAPTERIEDVAAGLVSSWTSADRRHHAIRHLVDVLASIDQLAEETHDPDAVRLAGWYHGAEFTSARRASYAHKGGEDPIAGAERARRELPTIGVPADVVDRIAAMVEQVHRHSAAASDVDAQALSDADLAGLAAEPQKYAEYLRNIRAEYAHIPAEDYLEARIAILQKLRARPRLFCSPMGQQWEEAARENLAAELTRLTDELDELERTGHEPDGEGAPAQTAAPTPHTGEGPQPRPRELSPERSLADVSTTTLGRAPRSQPRS
ncbi:MAG TPA: hypothetical protein DHV14_03935 [Micrococcales bacterium]|nr:hypothetical protein [Micrococcales bacterium]